MKKNMAVVLICISIFSCEKSYEEKANISQETRVETFSDSSKQINVLDIHYPHARVIKVKTEFADSAFQMEIMGDYRKFFVEFVHANEDNDTDIVIELADESGFSPLILLNHGNKSFSQAFPDKIHYSIEYANLESTIDGHPYALYQFQDLNNDGRKELVFHHLYHGRELIERPIFILKDGKYIAQKND